MIKIIETDINDSDFRNFHTIYYRFKLIGKIYNWLFLRKFSKYDMHHFLVKREGKFRYGDYFTTWYLREVNMRFITKNEVSYNHHLLCFEKLSNIVNYPKYLQSKVYKYPLYNLAHMIDNNIVFIYRIIKSKENEMSKKEKILERIKIAKEELARAERDLKQVEETPEYGEQYHYITDFGEVRAEKWTDVWVDRERYLLNNVFNTFGAAADYLFMINVETKLRRIAKRLNNGRVVDWTNQNQNKYSIYLNEAKNHLYLQSCGFYGGPMLGIIYCLSSEFLDAAIEEIGKDKLINYIELSSN